MEVTQYTGRMTGNGNGGVGQSWAALRGTNGIGNSMGSAGLQSAYSNSGAHDGGGIYKMINGELVEATYKDAKASWDTGSEDSSSTTTTTVGGGGGGPSNFVYNGVWAAAKGGKSMASNPLKKMKAIDWFSPEMRLHMDNIADDPARARAHRYVQYARNREAAIQERVEDLNRRRFSMTAKQRMLESDRLRGYIKGDIDRAAGKGSAKALSDHIGTRIDKLKGVNYDTMRKHRQQVLSDLAAGVERDKNGKIVKEGVGSITREGLARTQGQIRDERSQMGQRVGDDFSSRRWAEEKALGATSMGYAQWKDWSQRRAKEEDSKKLSEKIWRAELDKRKLDRAEQNFAAVDTLQKKRDDEVRRLQGLQTEVGKLINSADADAVNAVAEKLAGGVVRVNGPVIQGRMQDDIAKQDTQGAPVQKTEEFLDRQTAAKGGYARRKFKVLSRRNRRAR